MHVFKAPGSMTCQCDLDEGRRQTRELIPSVEKAFCRALRSRKRSQIPLSPANSHRWKTQHARLSAHGAVPEYSEREKFHEKGYFCCEYQKMSPYDLRFCFSTWYF